LKVRLVRSGKERLEFEVEEDLITVFTALQHEALKDERVVFAAYKKPHPLFSRTLFAIAVKEGYDAKEVLLEVISSLRKRFINYLEALKVQLAEGEGD
jgi:DNA-directed RNA polymerase II subunit RPB11